LKAPKTLLKTVAETFSFGWRPGLPDWFWEVETKSFKYSFAKPMVSVSEKLLPKLKVLVLPKFFLKP
jgi:hypothetical protein